MKRSGAFRNYALWAAAAALVLVIFGTIYAAVQQNQRADANDPQIQLAEDTAAALKQGADPSTLVSGYVNPSTSLAPFVVIYGEGYQPIVSSGYLHGDMSKIPHGVLTSARFKPYNAVTWQPEPGVRIAAVVVAAKPYYVLAGRSLTQVERGENRTLAITAAGCLVAELLVGAIFVLQNQKAKD